MQVMETNTQCKGLRLSHNQENKGRLVLNSLTITRNQEQITLVILLQWVVDTQTG